MVLRADAQRNLERVLDAATEAFTASGPEARTTAPARTAWHSTPWTICTPPSPDRSAMPSAVRTPAARKAEPSATCRRSPGTLGGAPSASKTDGSSDHTRPPMALPAPVPPSVTVATPVGSSTCTWNARQAVWGCGCVIR